MRVFATALIFSLATPTWAGRPLATEDAAVLERGDCEIESYAARASEADAARIYTRWAQFGCGIGLNTQLALGSGDERSEGLRTKAAALIGKTFVRELTDEQAGFTIAYTLGGVRLPAESFKHETTEIKGVVTVPHGPWLFHANLGWQRAHLEKTDSTVWALAAERLSAVGPVDLMAEVFGDDRTAPWVQVAARWAVIPKRFFLDASWGVQTTGARPTQATVGLKISF